jgi:hypothetical protein
MNETPLNFDVVGNQTTEIMGAETVLVKTTECRQMRFRMVLSCVMGGRGGGLKHMVLFNRKIMPKIKFSAGGFVYIHGRGGWMKKKLSYGLTMYGVGNLVAC